MDEEERERLEREGWQLLLWSYRHELGVGATHIGNWTPGDWDDKAWGHAEQGGPA